MQPLRIPHRPLEDLEQELITHATRINKQTLPYRIVSATEVADEEEDDPEEAFLLKIAVSDRLLNLLRHKNEQLVEILETTVPSKRLQIIEGVLSQVSG